MSEYDCLSTYDYKVGEYRRIPGTEDWATVAELGDGGYEWQEFKVFYSPSQRIYFWKGDAGCSCNSWGEDLTSPADFENGDKAACIGAWERFVKDHSYSFNPSEYLDGVVKIGQFKLPTGN